MPAHEPVAHAELAERRRRLQSQLGEGVALIPGAKSRTRSHDTDYVFRQDSDLYYLTGWEQPDALAAFTRDRFVLFVQPRDPLLETWNGRRPGTEGAVTRFGADRAHPIGELAAKLPGLIENRPRLFHTFGHDPELDTLVVAALADVRARVRRGVIAPSEISSPHALVHEMRLRKSARELEVMRAAAAISHEAHHEAAKLAREGAHEYELEAALLHVFRKRGGAGPAYNPIVGTGENATVLHYVENKDPLRTGELVLIDAGVELYGYASDVTRGYPVGGKFSGAARDVYQAVLDAQAAVFAMIAPGVTLPQMHQAALRPLVEGLVALGALQGDVDELIQTEAYKPFYMHTTGHLLGLDVHDVGSYFVDGAPRALEAGMCFTVEPGLYFSATEPKTPAHLRGIGVRIEDDVVLTASGYENLTRSIPKEIPDVEAWMRS